MVGVLSAITGLIAFIMVLGGIWFLRPAYKQKKDDVRVELGAALIAGAAVGLAALALQLYAGERTRAQEIHQEKLQEQEANREKREAQRQQEHAAQEAFELAVSLTSDLSGFKPPSERKLAGMWFGGKILAGANLENENLTRVVFRDAVLRAANLNGAKLESADLVNADLYRATLTGADLTNADLRYAKLEEARILDVGSLDGARVNDATCWPPAFFRLGSHFFDDLQPDEPGGFGHPCAPGEHRAAALVR